MLHLHLTPAQQDQVQALRHDATLKPVARDRVEMCLLSHRGWTAPAIADHLDCTAATVRRHLRRMDARYQRTAHTLRHRQDSVRREQAHQALTALKNKPRSWT